MKVLVLGAGIHQVRTVQRLVELGHNVIVADRNPQAVGVQWASEYQQVDLKDFEALRRIACDRVIVPGCDRGLPTETRMMPYLNHEGFKYFAAEDKLEWCEGVPFDKDWPIPVPCIVKPRWHSGGGKRVWRIEKREALDLPWFDSSCLIAPLYDGDEYKVAALVRDGQLRRSFMARSIPGEGLYPVEAGSFSAKAAEAKGLERILWTCARLNLRDVAVHVDVMVDRLVGPQVIDADLCWGSLLELCEEQTGEDVLGEMVELWLK